MLAGRVKGHFLDGPRKEREKGGREEEDTLGDIAFHK